MKNTIIGLILGLIIAMWAFYLYTQKPVLKDEAPPITPTSTVVSPGPSINKISDEESIKQAFAQKYNREVDEVHLNISKKDSTHVWGSVKFGDEIAGGWFLAFKESSNKWIIVQDGNGTISCETIAPYNFPVSMVSECVDQNGKLQKF
ncbi:TPA: hypothetical protein DD455_04150 [Candidatus Shapirobacteria bacterium]|nr:hypothetical protein [Candidatus Shapirobacteria bacterium]